MSDLEKRLRAEIERQATFIRNSRRYTTEVEEENRGRIGVLLKIKAMADAATDPDNADTLRAASWPGYGHWTREPAEVEGLYLASRDGEPPYPIQVHHYAVGQTAPSPGWARWSRPLPPMPPVPTRNAKTLPGEGGRNG